MLCNFCSQICGKFDTTTTSHKTIHQPFLPIIQSYSINVLRNASTTYTHGYHTPAYDKLFKGYSDGELLHNKIFHML